MRLFNLVLCVILGVGFVGSAIGTDYTGVSAEDHNAWVQEVEVTLNLTDAQKSAFKRIIDKAFYDAKAVANASKAGTISQSEASAKMKTIQQDKISHLEGVLTTEQMNQYNKIMLENK